MTVGLGIRLGLLDRAVTVRVGVGPVTPLVMPLKVTVCRLALALRVRLDSAFKVGGWLTALTVTVKLCVTRLFALWPLLTVTEMVVVPTTLVAGLKVKVPVLLGLT